MLPLTRAATSLRDRMSARRCDARGRLLGISGHLETMPRVGRNPQKRVPSFAEIVRCVRIFSNLFSNILKYVKDTPVHPDARL